MSKQHDTKRTKHKSDMKQNKNHPNKEIPFVGGLTNNGGVGTILKFQIFVSLEKFVLTFCNTFRNLQKMHGRVRRLRESMQGRIRNDS